MISRHVSRGVTISEPAGRRPPPHRAVVEPVDRAAGGAVDDRLRAGRVVPNLAEGAVAAGLVAHLRGVASVGRPTRPGGGPVGP